MLGGEEVTHSVVLALVCIFNKPSQHCGQDIAHGHSRERLQELPNWQVSGFNPMIKLTMMMTHVQILPAVVIDSSQLEPPNTAYWAIIDEVYIQINLYTGHGTKLNP